MATTVLSLADVWIRMLHVTHPANCARANPAMYNTSPPPSVYQV